MIQFQPSTTPPAPPLAGETLVGQMADAMRRLAFGGRTVDKAALRLEGFTGPEIDAHWEAACDQATRDSIRKVS